MSEKRTKRSGLLRSVLNLLVEEYGYEAVHTSLEGLRTPKDGSVVSRAGSEAELLPEARGSRSSEKPTATVLAAKASLPPTQKQLIHLLAVKFDDKQFLPTAGDIRYFFEVHGEAVPPIKQRSEAFRRVLRTLSSLSESSLRNIIDKELHSGPSSLAPLSDAMRSLGSQRSGEREPSEHSAQGDEPSSKHEDQNPISDA